MRELEFTTDTEEGMMEALTEIVEVHGVQRTLEALQETIEQKEEEAIDETEKNDLAMWATLLETALSRSEV